MSDTDFRTVRAPDDELHQMLAVLDEREQFMGGALDALERRFAQRLRAALEADTDSLGEVLAFYADPATYERLNLTDEIPSGLSLGDSKVLIDRGARARRAQRVNGAT